MLRLRIEPVHHLHHGCISHWRYCGAVHVQLEGACCRPRSVLGCRELGHRHGLSPLAHPSRLQMPEVGGILFTVCATLALEGGPIFWVATHRVHHQITDKPGDPHSPRDGGFWAHMGWILTGKTFHNNNTELLAMCLTFAKTSFTSGSANITGCRWSCSVCFCWRSADGGSCSGGFSCAPCFCCIRRGL